MTLVSDLEIIPTLDKFVIGGKRLFFYENVAFTRNMKHFNDDICAIAVEFNEYYNWFVVLTKIDIRVYDALTGRLKKVFNDIHDDKSTVDLSCLCFGGKQRKFYVADNSGVI